MLLLSASDVESCVSILDMLEAAEEAFLIQESGAFNMPDRMHVEENENVVLLMPVFADKYFSTKIAGVFPGNKDINEPTIHASVLLSDARSGKQLALIDGSILTKLRTGAVGGLGIAYTTPKETDSIGIIGAGQQAFHQVMFAATVRNIRQVFVYDPYHPDLDGFINKLKSYLDHIDFHSCGSAEELVKSTQTIITATTSKTPVVPNQAALLQGRHFIGIGSYRPEMRELPDLLFSMIDELIVDTDTAKQESGDVRTPLESGIIGNDQVFRLGQLINGEKKIDVDTTTFFKSVGMALLDLTAAQKIYQKAIENGIGTMVNF
jgi:ornithine cyclodeaminase